jgi:Uma2 family endonuclease
VRASTKRPASYDDLLALPETVVGQIVDGVLIASPRPAIDHALVSSALGQELGGPFHRGRGGPGGWWILDEPELHLGPDVLVPDLAGWRRTRLPALPRRPFLDLVPDWACEILSPSTASVDRVPKMAAYAREGLRHLWIIDPAIRTLEVYRLGGSTWTVAGTYRGEAVVRAEPFDAIELELGVLWLPEPGDGDG